MRRWPRTESYRSPVYGKWRKQWRILKRTVREVKGEPIGGEITEIQECKENIVQKVPSKGCHSFS